jgi:imidazolonepropionase-like amidohydrolase
MAPACQSRVRTGRIAGGMLIRFVPALLLMAAACGLPTSPPAPTAAPTVIALVGGRVQPTPDAPVISDGVVIVRDGVLASVGRRSEVRVPAGATLIDCAGGTVMAGFWNSHVHFTAEPFRSTETASADRLADGVRSMLTSYGVVRVLDTGSWLPETLALRRRIESGEIPGPAILTTGTGFVPPGGSPFYVAPLRLPELTSAEATPALVDGELDRGADALKLFTGSFARPDLIVVMTAETVRAATETAHRRGKLVVAHPSNSAGARVAIEGGVDVLVHTFPSELDRRPWDRALPGLMVERRMALVPTLKLFVFELSRLGLPPQVVDAVVGNAQAQLRAFADLGGQVLFGTDVGYMTDHDPTDEYVLMQEAGLSYSKVLAALTTAPAERFGASHQTGRLVPGLDADIAVVEGNPEQDIRALGRVRYTLRGGRLIYRRAP